jgi:proline iminopeptidase
VILLHGGPGVPDEMTEVAEWFHSHSMQVINFDQRGIGLSENDNCDFGMEAYIADINRISSFFGIDHFHLFGHSWGGLYAQLYASSYPEKLLSLFLCSPASGTGHLWKMTEREIFRYNWKRSTMTEWIGMAFNTGLGLLGNKKAYRNLFRQIIINYHKGYHVDPPDEQKLARISAKAGVNTRNAIKRAVPVDGLGKTNFPVIITYGEFDAYGVSRNYVLNRFPNAQKTIIPASGHTPWKHNFPAFKNVLADFYAKLN